MHGKLIAVATMAALLSTAAFAQNSNNNMQKATPPQNTNADRVGQGRVAGFQADPHECL
jgi:uncharacterized protein YdeI (BOF family)